MNKQKLLMGGGRLALFLAVVFSAGVAAAALMSCKEQTQTPLEQWREVTLIYDAQAFSGVPFTESGKVFWTLAENYTLDNIEAFEQHEVEVEVETEGGAEGETEIESVSQEFVSYLTPDEGSAIYSYSTTKIRLYTHHDAAKHLTKLDPFDLIEITWLSDADDRTSSTYSVQWTAAPFYISSAPRLVKSGANDALGNAGAAFDLTITEDTNLEIQGILGPDTPFEKIPFLNTPLKLHVYNVADIHMPQYKYITLFKNSHLKINGVTISATDANGAKTAGSYDMTGDMTIDLPYAPSILVFDAKVGQGSVFSGGTIGDLYFRYKYSFNVGNVSVWLNDGGVSAYTQMDYSGGTFVNIPLDTSKQEVWISYYR